MGVSRIRLPVSLIISIPQGERTASTTIHLNINADNNAQYALAA